MKNFRWILLAGLLVTAPQLAHAQPPAAAPGAATDSGAISNGANGTGATVTTQTTVNPGVAPDAQPVAAEDAAMSSDSSAPSRPGNTGGEPMLVALAGLSVAAMAFGLRRKTSNVSA